MKGYAFGVMYHDNWKWLKEYRPEVLKLIESKGGKYLAVAVMVAFNLLPLSADQYHLKYH